MAGIPRKELLKRAARMGRSKRRADKAMRDQAMRNWRERYLLRRGSMRPMQQSETKLGMGKRKKMFNLSSRVKKIALPAN